jgi:multidrug efflux pump subunit AcrA (membrane-fusion protein)
MVAILERLTQAQKRQEVQMQRQAQDTAAAFAQIQAHQDEFQRQQLEFQRQQYEMQRQQAATQQQYIELLRHLVTVGVPPPLSVHTLALQSSGPQSRDSRAFSLPLPSSRFLRPFSPRATLLFRRGSLH